MSEPQKISDIFHLFKMILAPPPLPMLCAPANASVPLAQLALLQESLTSKHHKQQLETLAGINRHCWESHEARILEEKEHLESA